MHATSPLPDDAPLWRRLVHPDGYGYGGLLLLILISLGFQVGAPEQGWSRVVIVVLQSATLLASLHVSRVHRWIIRAAWVVTIAAALGAVGSQAGSGELAEIGTRSLGLMLGLMAPAAIVAGVVRQARAEGAITIKTMFGVLCVYLLLGTAFAFAFGLVSSIDDGRFFAQFSGGSQSDFLYFSFSTMTTTGYGDLTAVADLGRSLAITEALIGQIYLVTVVALIVSNLTRTRARAAR
ncbi:MAG: hypothetical protein GEU88_18390 [Solirubrobacterales bacterium]|nr:hypothetical protein [Solirubrobacterales bacterium]